MARAPASKSPKLKPVVAKAPASSKIPMAKKTKAKLEMIPAAVNSMIEAAAKSNRKTSAAKKTRALKSAPKSTELESPQTKAETGLENKLASQPPKALRSPIKVFQMHSEDWQRELLDPAFYPLDVSRVNAESLELTVCNQLANNKAIEGATLWGAISWRFTERTGMQGRDWVKQIEEHPGADVYFCNPKAENEVVFHNPWLEGETLQPRFIEVAQTFLLATGMSETEVNSIYPSSTVAGGGYMVGTSAFWRLYIPFVQKLMKTADQKMPPPIRDLLHSPVADENGKQTGATYLTLIVERLLPVFLRTEGKGLKAYKIALPERERELNVHQKLLREMKDVAHRTQSAWLGACWVNYRNLYLGQTQGKVWCQKYLRLITPTEIKFA
jgi:hypothetical protein